MLNGADEILHPAFVAPVSVTKKQKLPNGNASKI
jgi:hypothetical protein